MHARRAPGFAPRRRRAAPRHGRAPLTAELQGEWPSGTRRPVARFAARRGAASGWRRKGPCGGGQRWLRGTDGGGGVLALAAARFLSRRSLSRWRRLGRLLAAKVDWGESKLFNAWKQPNSTVPLNHGNGKPNTAGVELVDLTAWQARDFSRIESSRAGARAIAPPPHTTARGTTADNQALSRRGGGVRARDLTTSCVPANALHGRIHSPLGHHAEGPRDGGRHARYASGHRVAAYFAFRNSEA